MTIGVRSGALVLFAAAPLFLISLDEAARSQAVLDGDPPAPAAAAASYLDELYGRARQLLDGSPRYPAEAARILEETVGAGDPKSMVALAELYMHGDGVEASESRAAELLKEAVAAGLAKEGWAGLAELYREDGPYANPRLEREALEHASEAGDQPSMVALAQLLVSEESFDFDRLRSLLAHAISTEGPLTAPAWGMLGDLYLDAAVPKRDFAKAAEAYEQATLLGHARSMIKLARLAKSGEGVSQNFDRARLLLESVVSQGGDTVRHAWRELGDLYAEAEAPNGDPAKAVDAYQQAADLGDAESLIRLAAVVGTGRGGAPTDFNRAVKALRAAIKMDQSVTAKASALLGDLYRDAAPPEGNAARSVEAYQQAADAGDQWSAVKLAQVLGTGAGVPPDFDRARALLEKSIAAGGDVATTSWATLAKLYADGSRPWHDLAKAAEAYRQAADGGDVWSMIALARMLAAGDGAPVDFGVAETLLTRAIADGSGDSSKSAWALLGDVYRDAPDGNRAHAVQAYQQAVDRGDQWSAVKLAQIVGTGAGVPPDFDRARALLEKGIAAGGDVATTSWATLAKLYADGSRPWHDARKAAEAYGRAAEAGDVWSMISLARMLAVGGGVPRDFGAADALLKRAIAEGSGDSSTTAWGLLGDLNRDTPPPEGDPARAVDAYQQAVDAGDLWSAIKLSLILGTGAGVRPDFDRARALLEKGIAAGGDLATTSWATLAKLYADGSQPWHDLAKAAKAYRHAADAGDVWSMISLARMLAVGDGIPADFSGAEALLKRAIDESAQSDESSKTAWAMLGDLYGDAAPPQGNAAQAVDAYQRAVDAGDLWSAVKLAQIVGTGAGLPPDFERARVLLRRGIAAGGDLATVSWATLARLYADGSRPWHDPAKAAEAYWQAADGGDIRSMVALGRMLAVGVGIPPNFDMAEELLKRAIGASGEGTDTPAKTAWALLGDLYRDATLPQDYSAQAVDAYQHAVDAGDTWSAVKLGQILGTGAGVPPDFRRARALLERGIAAGGDVAKTSWATLAKLYA
ncbi:MAG: tetratricopeptide repeat protein, partial [Propylenella sp.]